MMHGTEGIVRFLMVIGVVVFSKQLWTDHEGVTKTVASPGFFGLALVLPPIIAVLVSLYKQHGLAEPGPDAPYSELSSALAWLLAASVLAQVLSYAPVFAAQVLVSNDAKSQAELAGFVTAMFLHSPRSLMHIGFNMYALFILGTYLEPLMGRARFLAVYLISGVAGQVAVVLLAGNPTVYGLATGQERPHPATEVGPVHDLRVRPVHCLAADCHDDSILEH
jgi:membrane associated rhomboid family serine protease